MIKKFNEFDLNESLKNDLINFLEKELQYNEDSHVDDKDVEQIYHAFIGKYTKYKNQKTLPIYDVIYDYFSVLTEESKSLSYSDLMSSLKSEYHDSINEGSSSKIEKNQVLEPGTKLCNGQYNQFKFEVIKDDGNKITIKNINKDHKKEEFTKDRDFIEKNYKILNEAKQIQVKRKYGIHPPQHVSSHAPLRERVLGAVKENDGMTETELQTYISGIREESGRSGDPKWLEKNKEFFKRKGEKMILSEKGERYLSAKTVNESESFKVGDEFFNDSSKKKVCIESYDKEKDSYKVQVVGEKPSLKNTEYLDKKEIERYIKSGMYEKINESTTIIPNKQLTFNQYPDYTFEKRSLMHNDNTYFCQKDLNKDEHIVVHYNDRGNYWGLEWYKGENYVSNSILKSNSRNWKKFQGVPSKYKEDLSKMVIAINDIFGLKIPEYLNEENDVKYFSTFLNETKNNLIDKMNSIHNKIKKQNSYNYGILDKFEKKINIKFDEYFNKNNTNDLNYSDLSNEQLKELIKISLVFLEKNNHQE